MKFRHLNRMKMIHVSQLSLCRFEFISIQYLNFKFQIILFQRDYSVIPVTANHTLHC